MTARITTQLSDELYAQVKALAKEGRESLSWLVERAVRNEVQKILRERREDREALLETQRRRAR